MTAASALSLSLPVASVGRRQAVISASAKTSGLTPPAPAAAATPISIKTASKPSPLKEQAVTGLTALALTAAMVVPEIAEAAQPALSPSLKNFLLSILSGGVVLGVLIGAVVGVSNFDPVKRT